MIVVWGDRDDSPIERVLAALRATRARVFHVDGASLAGLRYDLRVDGSVAGWFAHGARRVDVARVRAMYLRPPPTRDPRAEAAAGALLALASLMPGIVVNRPPSGRSNASKPYQLGLIAAAGLDVPDTLVTTDVGAAGRFLDRHARLIYKSVSGIRSIVGVLEPADRARLDEVAAGPVQLQAHIPGVDVRVHVVGERWFACAIRSDAPDYRYAASTGGEPAELEPFELPSSLGARLVALARSMGLVFAGIDLRLTPDGRWICFEVNPSQGFSWYEEATGHPIAAAVAELLRGAPRPVSGTGR